ncbi:MAG TPA: NUDIX domain-containing protein [Candidatus Avipropionibacterium avicola]|uniref:NUDIX domain-containing protein n=1 Tax=Candidatus Avipropionibacterium avicola TaxID=2840701 RepID=A0A9D1GVY0_9ACTN|nr:NUDIX domain-containing protein [Candidatus Avipropionibacterium avicola]
MHGNGRGSTVVDRRRDDGTTEVLLIRRADTGRWSNVAGIIEPGEEPADAAERETLEEARVVVVAEKLVWVRVLPPMQWANGDQAQSLDLVFRCRHVSGDPAPLDGENTDPAWFGLDELPPLPSRHLERIEVALADEPATRFERNGPTGSDRTEP